MNDFEASGEQQPSAEKHKKVIGIESFFFFDEKAFAAEPIFNWQND